MELIIEINALRKMRIIYLDGENIKTRKVTGIRNITKILETITLDLITRIRVNYKNNQVILEAENVQIIINNYNQIIKSPTIRSSTFMGIITVINKEIIKKRIKDHFAKLKLIIPDHKVVTLTGTTLLFSVSIGIISLNVMNNETPLYTKPTIVTYALPTMANQLPDVVIEESFSPSVVEIIPEVTDKLESISYIEEQISIEPQEFGESSISKAAEIFGFSYEEIKQIISNHIPVESIRANKNNAYAVKTINVLDTINDGQTLNYNRDELEGFLTIVDSYLNDHTIDKTPIRSTKTEEEKELYILEIAQNIYGVVDENILETMIMSRRWETGRGESSLCIDRNNQGGVRVSSGNFAVYKTFEIGAESFVRNFLKIYARSLILGTYNKTETIADIMGTLYCTEGEWIGPINNLINTESMPTISYTK